MREGLTESPLNPLPMAVWLLALPIIASEAVFGLGRIGLIGGAQGVGLRLAGMQLSAYAPEMVQRMWDMGAIDWAQIYRLFSYSFVNASFTQSLFVLAFTLALGNLVARQFRPTALIMLFFGSAAGGALVYTVAMAALPGARVVLNATGELPMGDGEPLPGIDSLVSPWRRDHIMPGAISGAPPRPLLPQNR